MSAEFNLIPTKKGWDMSAIGNYKPWSNTLAADVKYDITRTKAGWEIFQHGVSWGVVYNSMNEAYQALLAVGKSLTTGKTHA